MNTEILAVCAVMKAITQTDKRRRYKLINSIFSKPYIFLQQLFDYLFLNIHTSHLNEIVF